LGKVALFVKQDCQMAQIKIYGRRTAIEPIKQKLSETIHSCVVEALELPPDKRFHRFILLEDKDFIYPSDRSELYIILEISMFEGRSPKVKKKLIKLLFDRIYGDSGIVPNDLEIIIYEIPKANWGIRGKPADELKLNYKVEI
jgi:phenylpyruvate tautomerase PptA (4-oxalocrotonate tautomerase family)